jgi:hypothetical protein
LHRQNRVDAILPGRGPDVAQICIASGLFTDGDARKITERCVFFINKINPKLRTVTEESRKSLKFRFFYFLTSVARLQ